MNTGAGGQVNHTYIAQLKLTQSTQKHAEFILNLTRIAQLNGILVRIIKVYVVKSVDLTDVQSLNNERT